MNQNIPDPEDIDSDNVDKVLSRISTRTIEEVRFEMHSIIIRFSVGDWDKTEYRLEMKLHGSNAWLHYYTDDRETEEVWSETSTYG